MRTVLLVEDHEPTAKLLAAALRDAGHIVHVASDAMGTLHALRFMQPDLILLDLELPSMGGLQLLRTIRAGGECPDVPVAVITATDVAAAVPKADDLGVVSIVSKHRYSLSEIVRHVNELLEPGHGHR